MLSSILSVLLHSIASSINQREMPQPARLASLNLREARRQQPRALSPSLRSYQDVGFAAIRSGW